MAYTLLLSKPAWIPHIMYSDGSQGPPSSKLLMTWSLKPAGLGECAKYLKGILLTQEAGPRQGRQPGKYL